MENTTVLAHEPCPRCRETREAGHLEAALRCPECKGRGIVRSRASFVCNGCGGGLCPDEPESDNPRSPHGLVEQTVSGGYDSYHLLDTTNYMFSLCEKCLRGLFDSFKIPPAVSCYLGDGFESYAEERTGYARRLWRDAGGHLERLAPRLCNATIECMEPACWQFIMSDGLRDELRCEGHKRYYKCSNEWLVPLADVPLDPTDEQVAGLLISATSHPAPAITFHKYVAGCIMGAIGRSGERFSALWHPDDAGPPPVVPCHHHRFARGTLYYGPIAEMDGYARLDRVQTANVLDIQADSPE